MEQAIRRPEVSVIPASVRSVESGGQIKKQKHLRVAAYCRVSTGDESQQTSYTTQRRFYTQMIVNRPGWTLAGIYADEAISGTSRAKRKQFNEMMADALNGKMDYIVTKSISRFARNTIDTLDCVRQLRQMNPPVGIFFEKENIDTLDATGELILTILSALAQDESRSISDNIRWAIQRKFQRGEPIVDLNQMLGYDKGQNGEWLINPEQAEIVRYIFSRFSGGTSANAIAKELNAMGKRTVRGSIWRADAVLYILRNEKYVGDCENQKYITKSFLTHESIVNHGESTKYYVNDHHTPIIDRLTWNKVQAMLMAHGNKPKSKNEEPKKQHRTSTSVFTNLTCGKMINGRICAETLSRMGYNNTIKDYTDSRSLVAEGIDRAEYTERYYYYYPVWRCTRNAQEKDNISCTSGSTYECALEQSFMEHLYWLKRDLEANGDESWLMRQFTSACGKLEQGDTVVRKNFDFFLRCLKELPETNSVGMKMNVNGLDVQGSIFRDIEGKAIAGKRSSVKQGHIKMTEERLATAPDYLNFEKGIYMAFIKSGMVKGDVVEYRTNFGVTLVTVGNSRKLSSFLGFRRANPDGTLTFLDEMWKVSGRIPCYTRKKRCIHRGSGEEPVKELERW